MVVSEGGTVGLTSVHSPPPCEQPLASPPPPSIHHVSPDSPQTPFSPPAALLVFYTVRLMGLWVVFWLANFVTMITGTSKQKGGGGAGAHCSLAGLAERGAPLGHMPP